MGRIQANIETIMEKQQLRSHIKHLLRRIPASRHKQKSARACRNLVQTDNFQKASVVMLFMSFSHEIDAAQAIRAAWKAGKTVVVPKMSAHKKEMAPVKIMADNHEFSIEAAGLRNPIMTTDVPLESIELIVTPALGYDMAGNRLGRGGSYYDRFFANAKLKAHRCGLAFSEQLLEKVPVAHYDQPVHSLVTDEQVIDFDLDHERVA